MSLDALRQEILRLGPWHHDLRVTGDLRTSAFLEEDPPRAHPPELGNVSFLDPEPSFTRLVRRLYPEGLAGKRMLDCACNGGGYLFLASDMGAAGGFGFDVRQHWIDQAHFLAAHREGDYSGLRFQVADLYDLPTLGLEPFDLTLFKGIFYHLPDPIRGLKFAADLTREVLILNTATRSGLPDGMLALRAEGTTQVMSGVYGLCWYPTGPEVLARILGWLGFPATRLVLRRESTQVIGDEEYGRLEMVAARDPGFFEPWDAAGAKP